MIYLGKKTSSSEAGIITYDGDARWFIGVTSDHHFVVRRKGRELFRLTQDGASWLGTSSPVDYSNGSNIIGWASFDTKKIWFSRPVNDHVCVVFNLRGMSNANVVKFAVPIASAGISTWAACMGEEGPGNYLNDCWISLPSGGKTATIYKNSMGEPWASNGRKSCWGQFFYFT